MKRSIFILIVVFVSCAAAKNNNRKTPAANQENIKQADSIPSCIRQLIKQYKTEARQNPPRKVYSYSFKGNTVYYITPPCCDFFSELYDSSCTLIGHPDGGFTGRGDGTVVDFDSKTNEKLIWKDERE